MMTDPLFLLAGLSAIVGINALMMVELIGYTRFRQSYFQRADHMAQHPTSKPDLARAAKALSDAFVVQLHPDRLLVRRQNGMSFAKRILAHATVVVTADGYELRTGAGPRTLFGAGLVFYVPLFIWLCLNHPMEGLFLPVFALVAAVIAREFLKVAARAFAKEVSDRLDGDGSWDQKEVP